MANISSEQFWSELSSTLLNHYLSKATDEFYKREGSLHQEYLELFIKVYTNFGEFTFFSNRYLTERNKFSFTKEFLGYCDAIADITINYSLFNEVEKIIENNEELLQKKANLVRLAPITENSTHEEINLYIDLVRKLHKDAKNKIKGTNKKFQSLFLKLVLKTFKEFTELFSKSKSPLEEMFIIGFLSHIKIIPAWSAISNIKYYEDEFNIDGFKFHFLVQDKDRNIKIAIKLDDNNYYERAESQSVVEKINDQILIQKGWKILRFHSDEIENNIENCINRISTIYQENRI